MGTRRVALVAQRSHTVDFLAAQLQELLGPRVDVQGHCFERGLQLLEADLVAATTPGVMSWLGPWLSPDTPLVILKRTLARPAWEQVMLIPRGTPVLVVNDSEETAIDTVGMLDELGVGHLKLHPWWPAAGAARLADAPVAMTTGEKGLVPKTAAQIVDLGPRVIDPSSIAEMLVRLGLYDQEAHNRLLAYGETVVERTPLRFGMRWTSRARAQLEAVFDGISEGILAWDGKGSITFANRAAARLLGHEAWQLPGWNLRQLLSGLGVDRSVLQSGSVQPRVIEVGGRRIRLERPPRTPHGDTVAPGGLLLLRETDENSEPAGRSRRELMAYGHVTRYSFHDIVGGSAVLQETIRRARKLAPGNGTLLILGESGTGKELFAHAIHRASPRSHQAFVAINCAAIPETLLESELFGYEDGAFTGARRGGKEGLFERANLGTIFLDEIGDLSPALQGRLLRVLQEKEILPVGGTRLRPIDVRVVAATHKDLPGLVKQGLFRADLYYRLEVLTLRVPPLRERPEDIPELICRFLEDMQEPRPVADESTAALLRYPWPGNIRELRNCVEYMAHVADGPTFRPVDLPPKILAGLANAPGPDAPAGLSSDPFTPARQTAEERELVFLLSALAPSSFSTRHGRRSLARQSAAAGLPMTESHIRLRLEQLADRGLLRLRQGASPVLTETGESLLARLTGRQPGENRDNWVTTGRT